MDRDIDKVWQVNSRKSKIIEEYPESLMIDKILESELSVLGDYLLLEDESIFKEFANVKAAGPTYLYQQLQEMLWDPRMGTYLSPARFLKDRSLFIRERQLREFEKLKEGLKGSDRTNKEKLAALEEEAYETAKESIKKERNDAIDKLIRGGKSFDEAEADVNRAMPYHSNVCPFTSITTDSQTSKRQDVHVATAQNESELDASGEDIIRRRTPNQKFLRTDKNIISAVSADDVYHDPNYMKMVMFGNGTALPDRQKIKINLLNHDIHEVMAQIDQVRGNVHKAKSDGSETIIVGKGHPFKNGETIRIAPKEEVAEKTTTDVSRLEDDDSYTIVDVGSDRVVLDKKVDPKSFTEAQGKHWLVSVYRDTEIPADKKAQYLALEGELLYYRSKKNQYATSAWSPLDLNKLIYGEKMLSGGTPNLGAIGDFFSGIRERYKIQDKGTDEDSWYEFWDVPEGVEGAGLIPGFYWKIGGQEGVDEKADRSFFGNKIRNSKDEEYYRKLKKDWQDSRGDLRKVGPDVYSIILKFFLDRVRGKAIKDENDEITYKGGLLQKKKDQVDFLKRSRSDTSKLEQEVDELQQFIDPDENGKMSLTIGNVVYSQGRGPWNDGIEMKDQYDKQVAQKNMSMLNAVDLFDDSYNMHSVLKRLDVAHLMMQNVDQSIYLWVLNRVMDAFYKQAKPDYRGALNIGSDPGVVNNFICNIDMLEERYGLGSRISWLLIPHIERHKKAAQDGFNATKSMFSITKKTQAGEDIPPVFSGKFEDLSKGWSTGVLDFNTIRRFRDKSGRIIRVTGEGKDYYMNLARGEALVDGTMDIDAIDDLISEMNVLQDKIADLEDEMKEIQKEVKSLLRSGDEGRIATLRVAHEEIMNGSETVEGITQLKDKIASKDSELNSIFGKLHDRSNELQKMDVKSLDEIQQRVKSQKRIHIDDNVFQMWLKNNKKDKEEQDLKMSFEKAVNDPSTSGTDRELARRAWINKRKQLEDEFKKHISQQQTKIDDDPGLKDAIEVASETYGDLDNERLAQAASEIYNRDKPEEQRKTIDAAMVERVMGGNTKRNDMLSFMMDTLKEFAHNNEVKLSDLSGDNLEDEKVAQSDKFMRAMAESITAMVEMSIITSSQTHIYGGRGVGKGTDDVYVDDFGEVHMPPGVDPAQLFGGSTDIYKVVREKARNISDWKNQLGGASGEEKAKLEKAINKEEMVIDEFVRKMQKHPAIKQAAVRSQELAYGNNPFHAANAEHLDVVLEKMRRAVAGEHVKWGEFKNKFGKTVDERDLVQFMHQHIPLMQNMGASIARVVGRYLCPMQRSIPVADQAGHPPTNSKDITDLGAMNHGNVLHKLLNILGAKKYLGAFENKLKEFGIHEKMKELNIPHKSIPYIALQLACYANGALMKGAVGGEGREITKDYARGLLTNYLDDVATLSTTDRRSRAKLLNGVITSIVNEMAELSIPDESDKEINDNLFMSTMPMFKQILDGTLRLADADIPFNPSSSAVIANLLDGIKELSKGGRVEDIERRIQDFMEFSDDLTANRKAEEIYGDMLGDLGNVDLLDNLAYLIYKMAHLGSMYKQEQDEQRKLGLVDEIKGVRNEMSGIFDGLNKSSVVFPDHADLNSVLKMVKSYKDTILNKVDTRIEIYAEDMPEIVDYLYVFRDAMLSSEQYHNSRVEFDKKIRKIDPDNIEAKREAEKDVKIKRAKLTSSLNLVKTKLADDMEGSTHRIVTKDGKLGSLSEVATKYKERLKIYDDIIKTRNKVMGSTLTDQEKAERYANIYKTLIKMTSDYELNGLKVAEELVGTSENQYKQANWVNKEHQRRAEKDVGNPEVMVQVVLDHTMTGLPLGTSRKYDALIFPSPLIAERLHELKGKTIEAAIYNPKNLLYAPHKSKIRLFIPTEDENIGSVMTIIMKRTPNKEDETYEYLDTIESRSVLVSVEDIDISPESEPKLKPELKQKPEKPIAKVASPDVIKGAEPIYASDQEKWAAEKEAARKKIFNR